MSRARAILEAEPRDLMRRAAQREKAEAGKWPVQPGDKGFLFILGENPNLSLNVYAPTTALAVERCNQVLKELFPDGLMHRNDRWDTTFHFDWTKLEARDSDIYDEWALDAER